MGMTHACLQSHGRCSEEQTCSDQGDGFHVCAEKERGPSAEDPPDYESRFELEQAQIRFMAQRKIKTMTRTAARTPSSAPGLVESTLMGPTSIQR